jgi:hypothetical protein
MLALARMILSPASYRPQSETRKLDLKLHPQDLLEREEHFELIEAQTIMQEVLQFLRVNQEQLKKTVESTGARWYEQGEEIDLPFI